MLDQVNLLQDSSLNIKSQNSSRDSEVWDYTR